jgi:hypothetical protein
VKEFSLIGASWRGWFLMADVRKMSNAWIASRVDQMSSKRNVRSTMAQLCSFWLENQKNNTAYLIYNQTAHILAPRKIQENFNDTDRHTCDDGQLGLICTINPSWSQHVSRSTFLLHSSQTHLGCIHFTCNTVISQINVIFICTTQKYTVAGVTRVIVLIRKA